MHHSGSKQTVSAEWVEHPTVPEFQLHPPNIYVFLKTQRKNPTASLWCHSQGRRSSWPRGHSVESQIFPQDVSGPAQKKGEEGITTSNLTSGISSQVQNLGMGFIFSGIISSNSGWQSELSVIQDEMNLRNSGKKNLRHVWNSFFPTMQNSDEPSGVH